MTFLPGDAGSQPVRPPAAPPPHPSGGFGLNLGHLVSAIGNTAAHAIGAQVPAGQPMLRYHPSTGVVAASAQALHNAAGWTAPAAQQQASAKSLLAGLNPSAHVSGKISEGPQTNTGLLGSIEGSVLGGLGGVGHVAGNLVGDVASLPTGLLKGATQLGSAALDDLLHGRLGQTNYGETIGHGQSHLVNALSQAASQDPLIQAAQGNFSKAAQLAGQHPLNAILDATGVGGVAGRALGGIARTGALGDSAANYAALARSREVAPGIPGTTTVKPYSRNIGVQAAQKAVENNPTLAKMAHQLSGQPLTDKLGLTGVPAALKKQTAMFYGTQRARNANEYQAAAQALKDSAPAGKVEAAVSPYITGFGGGVDTLQHMLQQYQDVKAGAAGPLRPSTESTLNQHIANLEAAVNKPNLNIPAIHSDAAAYAARQAPLEAQKAALGLHEDPALARALEKQYALQQIPGTHFIPGKGITHPDSIVERRQAGAALREANKNLEAAKTAAALDNGAHAGASRALTAAQTRLPVSPLTDPLANHLTDLRTAIDQSRVERQSTNAEHLAAAKDAVKAAQSDYQLAKVNPQRLKGLVVEDPAAREVPNGTLKGMQLRTLPSDEVRTHMAQDPNVSYIRMTNPERRRPVTGLRGDPQGGASATGKPYTGQAAAVGDWTPGRASMIRSQLGDVQQIGAARLEQNFLNRFGLKEVNGQPITRQNEEQAAAVYERQTGVPVEPWVNHAQGPDSVVLVPKAAANEMRAQVNLENPSKLGRAAMVANRAFRNTVLPMSPKLPVMHTIENLSRSMLAGASPQSYALARSVLKSMPDEAAAQLHTLAAPGSMAGHQLGLDAEDLGRLNARTQSLPEQTVRALPHIWNATAHKIISWQRWLESSAQTSVLGVHMRQQLQQMGSSWADANTAVSKYNEALANHYATPAMAEDAARLVHQSLGQYNVFTARQRLVFSRLMPFAPWYKSAATLVWHGLPAGHPLKTALVTDLTHANDPGWNAVHSGLPADMQSFAKMGPGHYLDIGKFSPIGIEKNPLSEGIPLVLPQYAGALAALTGHDPFWGDFKGPNTPFGKSALKLGDPGTVLQAADQLGQGMLGPLGTLARALQSHGSTLYNTSLPLLGSVQRKPGTQHGPGGILGGFEKAFNPFGGVWYGGKGAGASSGSGSKATFGGYSGGGSSTPTGQAHYGGY